MSQFILSDEALEDLWEIWKYVAEESSVERADIEKAMERLARNPGLGHGREDLAPEDTFVLFWAVYSYLIVYRPDKKKAIQIVRVIHGHRDVEAVLRDG